MRSIRQLLVRHSATLLTSSFVEPLVLSRAIQTRTVTLMYGIFIRFRVYATLLQMKLTRNNGFPHRNLSYEVLLLKIEQVVLTLQNPVFVTCDTSCYITKPTFCPHTAQTIFTININYFSDRR
jgi:hypothetical protein